MCVVALSMRFAPTSAMFSAGIRTYRSCAEQQLIPMCLVSYPILSTTHPPPPPTHSSIRLGGGGNLGGELCPALMWLWQRWQRRRRQQQQCQLRCRQEGGEGGGGSAVGGGESEPAPELQGVVEVMPVPAPTAVEAGADAIATKALHQPFSSLYRPPFSSLLLVIGGSGAWKCPAPVYVSTRTRRAACQRWPSGAT